MRRQAMFRTKNDLTEATRGKAIELLNARLADAIDLQTQTKHAHWNVKGPNFIALHELFDKINEDVEDYVETSRSARSNSAVSRRARRAWPPNGRRSASIPRTRSMAG